MKLYRTKAGTIIQDGDNFYQFNAENWDQFINDDELLTKMKYLATILPAGSADLVNEVLAPIGP